MTTPLRAVIDVVLPPRCPACGEIVDGDDRFCAACFGQLQALGPPQCACCGIPLPHEGDIAAQCGACLGEPPPFQRARAPFTYGGPTRHLVLALKHGRRLHLARMMARAMLRVAGDLPEDAVIVPVPSHALRLWQRGFNQAAEIARQLSRQSGRPLAVDALARIRATPSTKGLTRKARQKNVQGAFRVAHADQIKGRTVVLIDDVMTTGATVSACAAKLARAGARQVEVLTYARAVREEQAHVSVR
ncbi:ComF family protein [Sandarakinorhabdus sp. AAP62]|uniref:ComF family protein n=1 Tax=Sandarakinorhabdus sp. AAP62 TaxID=1248916 RepID=UPI001FB091B7|nr:ComF family protein [Sandarakinorhabdus sp. AAP62]